MAGESTPLTLLQVFATFRVGGPQMRFCAVANHFKQRFHHVVVAMDNQFDCRDRIDPGVDIEVLPLSYNKGQTVNNLRLFRRLLRDIRPNLLVTHNWGSIEWALANQLALVRHIHIEDGFGPEEATGQLQRRVWMRRLALRKSLVVVPSHTLEDLATRIWRLRRSSVHYIANGIDCARFNLAANRRPADVPVIGTVAALRPEKNISRLIEAFAIVRRKRACRLLIAGDGPERAKLEALAASLNLTNDVTFLGHRSDTEKVYAGLNIFALSSDTEQMPLSVIEAMASGLPIAGTDVGDVRRMVAAQNAPLIVERSAKSLASTLERLFDPALATEIGVANRLVARTHFDQDKMFAAYGKLFEG